MISVGRQTAFFYLCIVTLVFSWDIRTGNAQTFFTNMGVYQPAAQQSAVLNFYMHDNLDTNPASAFTVVRSLPNINGVTNNNLFGSIAVLDDSITAGSDPYSTEVGRGRGFYVFSAIDQSASSLEFVWTLVFNDASGYSGSTLTFKGYDKITDANREIAIVGGTGAFRMARGWATITTFAANGGAAVLSYTVNVFYGI